ncbi:ABC transporter ATP-binding protein [Dickeya sp. ws52]|uniref:ATP-binding cassette domain-containing protein n=1 Tax=Dickeya sp. ws52 TaxID=2576377 RepID=UPI00117E5083|nr:ABC transporter ATP-binding protein [Dickeya sp. ws52]TYL44592.1 ABC transporter ATP-binding protein [Dickeya sp. ws52]
MLDVKQLTLCIDGKNKINDVSFSLTPGERVCLLGGSGSGKSLTARCLLGVLPVGGRLSGSIRLQGKEVANIALSQRPPCERPAAIFQDSATSLNPLFSIEAQFRMALRSQPAPRALPDLLRAVGFTDPQAVLMRYPGELSGGQRQRLCIALALLCERPLLIADEPTTALDVVTQAQVLQTLQTRLQQSPRTSLLFITHDITVAAMICQRALVMENGRLVEQGDMRQLLNAPRHTYTRALIAAARQSSVGNRHNPQAVTPTIPWSQAS